MENKWHPRSISKFRGRKPWMLSVTQRRDENILESSLDELARGKMRGLEMGPNNPVHQRMVQLTREVWNLAEQWFAPEEDDGQQKMPL